MARVFVSMMERLARAMMLLDHGIGNMCAIKEIFRLSRVRIIEMRSAFKKTLRRMEKLYTEMPSVL